jgi:hypothetical protein
MPTIPAGPAGAQLHIRHQTQRNKAGAAARLSALLSSGPRGRCIVCVWCARRCRDLLRNGACALATSPDSYGFDSQEGAQRLVDDSCNQLSVFGEFMRKFWSVRISLCVCVRVCACMHICVCVCVGVCVFACMFVGVWACVHA